MEQDNRNMALPKRAIYNASDLHKFLSSRTKDDLLKFIMASGQSCATPSDSSESTASASLLDFQALSPGLAGWVGALRGMKEWLTELPPLTNVEMRFGNPVFKQWHQRLVDRAPTIMATVLKLTRDHPPQDDDYDLQLLKDCEEQGRLAAGTVSTASIDNHHDHDDKDHETVLELCSYLNDAFGHCIRLDYGTGHESSFQVTIYALFQIGVFGNPPQKTPPTKRRLKAATLLIWNAYLDVTRGLQRDYRLEPAGSHGVWGLDDYHCLPFYYGAQQLVPVENSIPSDIYKSRHDRHHNNSNPENDVDNHESYFLYFSCIDFIMELKSSAPFFETSPMLHDISGLPSWTKVAAGLYKLYQGEVLSKLPVVQHWVFGTHFPATWTPSQSHPTEAPTETFRGMPTPPPLQTTKAPWAK
ncbi:hypothetical protein MHU86_6163 [Fragilaria crotonensis]|nr:hypothetical protein MHU86_6163 [Fragilaria crotonensis]